MRNQPVVVSVIKNFGFEPIIMQNSEKIGPRDGSLFFGTINRSEGDKIMLCCIAIVEVTG